MAPAVGPGRGDFIRAVNCLDSSNCDLGSCQNVMPGSLNSFVLSLLTSRCLIRLSA